MGRLTERLAVARRALDTLCELPLGGTPTKVERDAAILRFECSFEAVWKAGQLLSPRGRGLRPRLAEGDRPHRAPGRAAR